MLSCFAWCYVSRLCFSNSSLSRVILGASWVKKFLEPLLKWPYWVHRAVKVAACLLVFILGTWSAFKYYLPVARMENILVNTVKQHTGMLLNIQKMHFGWTTLKMERVVLQKESRIFLHIDHASLSPHFFPLGVVFRGTIQKQQGEITLLAPFGMADSWELKMAFLGPAIDGGRRFDLPHDMQGQLQGDWQLNTRFKRSHKGSFPLQSAMAELRGAQIKLSGVKLLTRVLPDLVLAQVVLRAGLKNNRLEIETFEGKGNASFKISGSIVVNFRQPAHSVLDLKILGKLAPAWVQQIGPLGQIVQAQLASNKNGFYIRGAIASPRINPVN